MQSNFSSPLFSLSTSKQLLDGRCFLLVVIIILKLCVVSSQLMLMLASVPFEIPLIVSIDSVSLAVFRGLRSLQRQFVRLQSIRARRSYSSGSAGADHTAGKMQLNPQLMKKVSLRFLTFLWPYWPAADSVARCNASSQEDPKWPHQQPSVRAH